MSLGILDSGKASVLGRILSATRQGGSRRLAHRSAPWPDQRAVSKSLSEAAIDQLLDDPSLATWAKDIGTLFGVSAGQALSALATALWEPYQFPRNNSSRTAG